MLDQTFIAAITSLAPFWSSQLVSLLSLGNEYTMPINMVLSSIIKLSSDYLTDLIIVSIIFLCAFGLVLTKCGFNIGSKFNRTPSRIVVTERVASHEFNVSKEFKAIQLWLINEYQIKNLKYNPKFSWQQLADVESLRLKDGLQLSVKTNNDSVQITTWSYKHDLPVLLQKAVCKYCDNFTHSLVIKGLETEKGIYYSNVMLNLTKYFIMKYGLTKLKLFNIDETINTTKESTANARNTNANSSKQNRLVNKLEKDFMIANCHCLSLEDDIVLSVRRIEGVVYYQLLSNSINLQTYVNNCLANYQMSISQNPSYKYSITLVGEEYDDGQISYNIKMTALIDYLVTSKIVERYEIIGSDIVLSGENCIYFDDIILKIERSRVKDKDTTQNTVKFILESNTVDLRTYLEKIEKSFTTKKENINQDKIYYFKYHGVNTNKMNNKPMFTKKLLSSIEHPLFETFDFVHNEHSTMLKQDLEQLKDLDYYRRTGMRRKKSYLFHGEPGCGKNSTVLAMALHDRRHIIDIPVSLLETSKEFDEIMNLSSINNIHFTKSQIIYVFDEMDIGLEKMLRQEKEANNNKATIILNSSNGNTSTGSKVARNTIDLGCFLSQFDGINNYGGVIYIGLTNHLDRIPEPLRRALRLSPVYFTYLRQVDVLSLLKQYYQTKLTEEQIAMIPDRKISPAELKYYCQLYTIDELLKLLPKIILDSETLNVVEKELIDKSKILDKKNDNNINDDKNSITSDDSSLSMEEKSLTNL